MMPATWQRGLCRQAGTGACERESCSKIRYSMYREYTVGYCVATLNHAHYDEMTDIENQTPRMGLQDYFYLTAIKYGTITH